ncbi:ATP-grasp domain-containing protein [Gordonia sp. HY002]|uniref:ATP-binding protein n=1 Tax=Gordonia zhenghanii TaxID=2911516 RepID=UPI001EF0C616|nr:carboxyl transferase domain-containing protein [Gordonia zhenghanii]MCF8570557.1 ATP-grasp domain-containing protein [Gordonia zhenghanii]MCF8607334.1 ATP-grasp domain-containing protein [Gordonia zhenghanii]
MFKRIAIVNRGEAGMRLINAVRDLSAETGESVEVVALHTDVDRTSTYVREADIAYDLGPASARPYIDMAVLERALVESGADAAWVGWGFVAEDPAFAELCDRIGVTFIGPSAEAMRKLGDKIGAKLIAEEVGVPVAPWSRGPVNDVEEAKAAAAHIGYPLMLKATAGGGGRGIRKVSDDSELVDAYQRTREEAERAFGSGVVFLERLVTGARHVEVQVIADGQGTAWALGVRDCSVQRRNQKVIEESASPVLTDEQADEVKTSAERLANAVGYRGAATVEFLYHPGEKLFAFLEVNTRLQVEHPITELTNSFDLVRAQLHVASGNTLEGEKPVERGHAIEARLNAEDPDRDFSPAPGRIARLSLPTGPGIRVDTGVSEGDTIPADFDSMIAKVIAYGRDRNEALGRLRRAMSRTGVVIEGGATNKSFVLELLNQPEVIDGSADTGWIDRVRDEGRLVSHQHSTVALAAAAIDAYEEEEFAERTRLFVTASGGRPQVHHESGRPLDFKLRGVTYRVRVARVGAHRFRVVVEAGEDSRTADVDLERFDTHAGQVRINGVRYRLLTDTFGPIHLVDVDGVTHRVSRDEGGVVRAPAPALVIATPLEVGAEVEAGDPVLVLESMKMETVLRAPFKARLKECAVSVGAQVETGVALLRLEPIEDDAEGAETTSAAAALDLPDTPDPVGTDELFARGLEDLRGLLLGFDGDPADNGRLLDDYLAARDDAVANGFAPHEAETELVTVFGDISALSEQRPSDESVSDARVHSAREHFHTYLQSLDVDVAGVPDRFQKKLSYALQHYGVDELERTPDLEEAVFRIFLALGRQAATIPVITSVLRCWLSEPAPDHADSEATGRSLERLVAATQGRLPVVADLARGVLHAWYGQPRLRRTRDAVYTRVREHLAALDADPKAADRAQRIADMVRSTEPLVSILSERLENDDLDDAVMLEVLTRRYYGNKGVSKIASHRTGGCTFVVAERDGSTLVSVAASFDDLADALKGLVELAADTPSLDADIYLRWERQPASFDERAAALYDVISAGTLPESVHRITATVAGRGDDTMHHHFTFRQSATGLTEDRLIRGLHPHIARRMQMERLRKFDLTRLSSSDDEEVYLFRAVATTNPADDRLIAFAQIRDLTAVADDGELLTLPTAETTFATCVDAIRRAQTERPSNKRFNTNRIVMYIWPSIDVSNNALRRIVQHTIETASVDGAGLEEVLLIGRQRDKKTRALSKVAVRITFDSAGAPSVVVGEPKDDPVEPFDEYRQKVLKAASRGTVYPYELVDKLGDFTEYDLVDDALRPVDRPKGANTAAVVVGVVNTPTQKYPEGVQRVVMLGDPTKALGALTEPECRRYTAALDLAEELRLPVEWYALSSGAAVRMDSGTENLDWVAATLKRIVEFTQDGGEINIVVSGINVGGQAYWNAEATMLMHTRGILVMTPDSSMVLTGKQALDFSGGVSAEDNYGIGGYDRVMGPNGEAQYWAPDLTSAIGIVMSHYEHSYVVPGEDAPRVAVSSDPIDRDISDFPHDAEGSEFATVGEIFSATANPDRKKPFDIRSVMRAVVDQDLPALERWAGMGDADTVVVQDTHVGGNAVTLIGIESTPINRRGFLPTDGPDTFSAGTLFPQSSKKAARAINAASGNRPVVVLANLSGFDGSPESLRKLQLEYGAEIGRAIINFDGPIVFCVISRYHGGAFVVFSKALNPNMTVLAIDGSFASVLGGAPAAAVVFAGEVGMRTEKDPRVQKLAERASDVSGPERASLTAELDELRTSVRAEKISAMAAEFDGVHDIHRAVRVGSVDAVIAAADLRPQIIAAITR